MKLPSEMNLTDYDLRQINLMKEYLTVYKNGQLSIGKLINNLRSLLELLESINHEWKETFHEHWFTLEQVYAVALDNNEPLSNYQDYIFETISKLEDLLEI